MTGETDTEIPDTGAVFTFGKSKIANNVPSRLWLKNDIPVHISCGQSHSAFVTEQGRLFVFGSNISGQLGLQTKGPVTKPTCVKVLKGERVQFVACGTDHTLVSTSQGEIFAAGGNSDGQLGLGHCNASVSFQRLRPFCDYAPIKLLSAGGHTSAALTEDGRLFLWGDNSVGQLGLGNDSHALLPKELKLGQPIQWVSCGYRHSALVTDNGDVFIFGESADGRLGLSAHQLANHSCPQRVESLHRVLQVACGGKHTLALTEDELYCFGCGEFGQLGLGTLMFVADTPVAVGHFRKGRVTHVTCGENHSALITDSGLLYTFGDGRHGKLGHGDENFTNQFSPAVCQRLFDYTVMTVACGSSHMLVFARPRQQESEEVCLEDEDVTYSYLDRCYTAMLQGQPLEHIPDPAPVHVSQLTFLPSSLPTSHRWSLSTRARRRQRESSSAQFGPEFCNLPPLTTGFTALALTGNILQPRYPADTLKCFRTDAPVESPSTSITLPARIPQFTPITKSKEDCHSIGSSENSMSDKTHEQHTHKMARSSSIGKEVNVPRQSQPTEVQAGSVSHPSMTESPPPSNLKHKKRRSEDPKNPAMQDKHFNKADKYSNVQHADLRGQEVTTLAEMEQETKPSSLKIQKCSPVKKVKQVRTMPTKVQEAKSHQIKEEGIPVRATKSVKSPVKVQDIPSGRMEVNVVESTLHTDPAQKDIKPTLGKGQDVRSTLIDTQEQGNPTSVKIPAKMQNTSKKGNGKNTVDTEENTGQLTAKKKKKKRSDVERAPMKETTPKTPIPLSVSNPTRMSKAKKRKPVETENSNFQLENEMQVLVKKENDSKTLQNSNISFPPIENRKLGGTAEMSQSASNLQSEHKNSQSPTDKVLTEQKYEFPSIKSLQPERGHSFPSLWSNNESAISKSSITKETESSSGNLLSQSPQHRQSRLNAIKLDGKSVEPEEPDRKTQAEQGIMGSVVSSLPALAIASAAPLLIKAAEVLSETSPGQNNKMSLCASVSQDIGGSNILPEQEVDQDSTVQDISAIEEIDDNSTKKQSAQDVQNKIVSDENRKMEEEDVKDSETQGMEERSEEERLAEEEDVNEEVGQKEENSVVEDEKERWIDNDENTDSAQKGEENREEEEGEEEEIKGVEQKEVNSAVEDEEERKGDNDEDGDSAQKGEEDGEEEEGEEASEGVGQKEVNSAVEDEEEREGDNDEDNDSAQKGEEDGEEEEGEEESEGVGQKEENSAVEDEEERESNNNQDSGSAQKGEGDEEEEEGEEEESEGVGQKEENSVVEDEEERESDDDEDSDSAQKGEEDGEEEEGEEESEGVGQKEENSVVEDEEERESDDDEDSDSAQKGEEDGEEEEGEEESEGVGQKEENSVVEDEEERESDDDEDSDSAQKGEEDGEEEEGEEEESEAAGEEEDDSHSELSSKSEGETERDEEESEGEDGEMEEEDNKDEESGGEDEEEKKESWDEGSEGEVEDEEKTDAEEQEGESSNEEKMVVGEQSDSEDENKNMRSDEEEGESEENDRSEEEEEENETEEGAGEQEEKGDEESEEEDEEENQEEETDHEEEEGNRDQVKEEEEEEHEEEEVGEEDKEEEVDEEENNEELKDKKDGVTNSEEKEEESVKGKEERQNEVEAEDKDNIPETDGDEEREREEGSEQIEEDNGKKEEGEKEGKKDTSEVKFREENLDISGTREVDRGDEDDEVNNLNEMMEENNEEESGSEEEEEEDTDKEQIQKTDRSGRKQTETNEEEEHEETEEEEAEQKEMNITTEKNRSKQRKTSEEEEQEEESEEDEEEAERNIFYIKTEKNRRKLGETSEEEEEHEEESEEEEEEVAEQKGSNIKTEKIGRKQTETTEDEEQEVEGEEEEGEEEQEAEGEEEEGEEEQEAEGEEEEGEEEQEAEGEEEGEEGEEEQEAEGVEEEGEEEQEEEGEEEEGEEEQEAEGEEEDEGVEEEEEEEKTKNVPKQRDKPNVLPAHRQKNAQRDRQKTRQRNEQNGKGKKQTDDAQDPQFWNSVLPQYLNLK